MNIKRIRPDHHVVVEIEGDYIYIRFDSDEWFSMRGESMEREFRNTELERKYQQFIGNPKQ